jgi:hypothetical protein
MNNKMNNIKLENKELNRLKESFEFPGMENSYVVLEFSYSISKICDGYYYIGEDNNSCYLDNIRTGVRSDENLDKEYIVVKFINLRNCLKGDEIDFELSCKNASYIFGRFGCWRQIISYDMSKKWRKILINEK